jgi:UDP-N-acetyl-D-glucosamine dehydrogenase
VSSSRREPKLVCVQGLGTVGAANAVAIAQARDGGGTPLYRVVGVEQDSHLGRSRAASLSEGKFPFGSADLALSEATRGAHAAGNLSATVDPRAYAEADIIVVDVGLDLREKGAAAGFDLPPFQAAITTIGRHMRPDALVLLESTVPPGTCERVVAPTLRTCLVDRGFGDRAVKLAYSYERVMPGADYLSSITDMWRVYAGISAEAADSAAAFLASIVNPKFPLHRLDNIRSAELAKVLENSFRALNIAFIDEWERFGRRIDVDVFEVLEAIRVRPTHQNIRYPGLGVGGYCLTKDPLFGVAAAREIFGFADAEFPLSTGSVAINEQMPSVSLELLEKLSGGNLSSKKILILGGSYRADIGDTRHSPSIQLGRALLERGAKVEFVDGLAQEWPGDMPRLHRVMPPVSDWNIVVMAVAHREFSNFDIPKWAGGARPLIFDTNGVLNKRELAALKEAGFHVAAIGRGSI